MALRLLFCLLLLTGCSLKTPTSSWDIITDVNNYYNSTIYQISDEFQYMKGDYWTFPHTGMGDCEDIAIAKQLHLKSKNIKSYLALCWGNSYHAVLLIDRDDGTFVLDSLTNNIYRWTDTDYIWAMRQKYGETWWYVWPKPVNRMGVSAIAPPPLQWLEFQERLRNEETRR